MTIGTPGYRVATGRAHPARLYGWLLGGKDNHPADEAVGGKLPPEACDAARQNRRFMRRPPGSPLRASTSSSTSARASPPNPTGTRSSSA